MLKFDQITRYCDGISPHRDDYVEIKANFDQEDYGYSPAVHAR